MNDKEREILEDSKDFFKFINKANEVCVERGKFYDFECPLCKGQAKAIKSSYNGHLHAECKQCDMLVME